MSKALLSLALTLTALIGCTRTKWVAAVGNQRISKNTVELREKMMKVFDPNMNEKAALDQMIAFEVRKIILEGKGLSVSESELSAFLEGQRNEAKKNPTLASFLTTFEKDSSFKDVYLYPQVADKKVGDLYEKDAAFHKKELEFANLLLQKVQSEPARFEAIAKELSVSFLRGSLNNQTGMIEWEQDRDVASQSKVPADKAWFGNALRSNFLQKSELGKVAPAHWPLWFGYVIVRNDKSTKDSYQFSMVVAPRKGRWVWEKENSMMIQISHFKSNSEK